MIMKLSPPFFEIGPKNLLRRREIETIAIAAGRAGRRFGVTVVMTVPTALIAPVRDLDSGVAVYAQGMDSDNLGDSMFRVTAESLSDAGADGVMLNHDSRPLPSDALTVALERCADVGLQTIVCAATASAAVDLAGCEPTAVLVEPTSLIGTTGTQRRPWIGPTTAAIHRVDAAVLAMHAGGVSTPMLAQSIMESGADGTGSTSGVLNALDSPAAAEEFIAATRAGWDHAHTSDGEDHLVTSPNTTQE